MDLISFYLSLLFFSFSQSLLFFFGFILLFFILYLNERYDVMSHKSQSITHVTHCHILSLSQNHVTKKRTQKVLIQIILCSIIITCWPYRRHMYFRIGQLKCAHRPQSILYKYKVVYLVLRTLLSSFVLFKDLSHNTIVISGLYYKVTGIKGP